MTNMRPKTYFLRPDVAIPLGFALMREIWLQKVGHGGRPFLLSPLSQALRAWEGWPWGMRGMDTPGAPADTAVRAQ
jgi:hypothetical protein